MQKQRMTVSTPNAVAVALALAVGLAGCGDSTVLTGPDAEAAFAEAQATLEGGEDSDLHTYPPSGDDRATPVIFLDGARVNAHPPTVLETIRPEDIERIEVIKGCRAWGYLGDGGRGGEGRGDEGRNGGIIMIYTKSHDGTPVDITYDEDRARACIDEFERTRRFPWASR